MKQRLEFRGRSTCLFGDIIVVMLLSMITAGIYGPWGYVRIRKKVLANTYLGDEPLSFDGTGGQLFGKILKNLLLTLVTLGIYGLLMFPAADILRWDAEHTLLPGNRRLQYRGTALDLFGQVLVVALLSSITLGIYSFWGYVRIRSHIVSNLWETEQPLQFTGTGGQYIGIALGNAVLTVITLGIYALVGAASVRQLRWDAENTLAPVLGGNVTSSGQKPVEVHVTINQ